MAAESRRKDDAYFTVGMFVGSATTAIGLAISDVWVWSMPIVLAVMSAIRLRMWWKELDQ